MPDRKQIELTRYAGQKTAQKEYIDSPLTIGFYYGSTEKYNVNHI